MYPSYSQPPRGWNSSTQMPIYNNSSTGNTKNPMVGGNSTGKSTRMAKAWNPSFIPIENSYTWNSPIWRPPHYSVPPKMRPPHPIQQPKRISQQSSHIMHQPNHLPQQPIRQQPPHVSHQQLSNKQVCLPQPQSQQVYLKDSSSAKSYRPPRSQHAPWTGISWSSKMHLRHTHSVTVVLKLSPLDFSYGSPVFQEFIYHVLPYWKAYVPDAQNYLQKTTFATEVILHQSQLDSHSLAALLEALLQHQLTPSTLHLGSNPKLQEAGIAVLANYIRNSQFPLRWISLSKCVITPLSILPLLEAIIHNPNLYPRTCPTHPIPIWIDLGTIDATELFQQLDLLDSNLFCPAYDRSVCGINKCKFMGVVMHLAVIPPTSNNGDTTAKGNIEHESVLSEISSEEDEDEIHIDSIYAAPPTTEEIIPPETIPPEFELIHDYDIQDEPEEITYLHNVYNLFLKQAFIDISLYATRRRILPSELLRHMYIMFVENETMHDLPNLWVLHSVDQLKELFMKAENRYQEEKAFSYQSVNKAETTEEGAVDESSCNMYIDKQKDQELLECFPFLDSIIRSFGDEIDQLIHTSENPQNYAEKCIERQNIIQEPLLDQQTTNYSLTSNSQNIIDILDMTSDVPYDNSLLKHPPPAPSYFTKAAVLPTVMNNSQKRSSIAPNSIIDDVTNTEPPCVTHTMETTQVEQDVEEGEITESSVTSRQTTVKKRKAI